MVIPRRNRFPRKAVPPKVVKRVLWAIVMLSIVALSIEYAGVIPFIFTTWSN